MTRAERLADRRLRAWVHWYGLRGATTETVARAWWWVVGWDGAYHEAVLEDFIDKYA